MSNSRHDSSKSFLEIWNEYLLVRSQMVAHYTFPDNEIVSPGVVIRVSLWLMGVNINLHPTQYAVAIAPDGKIVHLKGGFNYIPAGRYILHYIDKQNRVFVVHHISETSLDGVQVSLKLVIMYQVVDPIKALEIKQPVSTFITFIQSYLKEFIRSHQYNELIGSDRMSTNKNTVLRYIKTQFTERNLVFRLFNIIDLAVEEIDAVHL